MKDSLNKSLLSQLAGGANKSDSEEQNPWNEMDADAPEPERAAGAEASNAPLDALMDRINRLANAAASGSDDTAPVGRAVTGPAVSGSATGGSRSGSRSTEEPATTANVISGQQDADEESHEAFFPLQPESFEEAQLSDIEVEDLALKVLLARGTLAGREIAEQVRVPFTLVEELFRQMKHDQLIGHRRSAPMNDFVYELSDLGRERARRLVAHCTYFGSAPISLEDYIKSVEAQSLCAQHPTPDDLVRAFDGLLLNRRMMDRLGPAMNSGRGLFLYGAPGNGKTSIAERVTKAFGQAIWIPRALGIDGEIIRMFDPVNHEELPLPANTALLHNRKIDSRWVRIRRPTIVAGGELTMSSLEVTINRSTGTSEAPLQLKSNCGTLVIDDFGRQRMSVDDLLNRWIVPLEKRYDFLNMPNGKKIQVPFDELIIFSTNLEPRDLVDEAFLRRIPYKIEVVDPTEEEFRDLFRVFAPKMGFEYDKNAIDHLINEHYLKVNRPFRFCQPRDILLQVRNYCKYHRQPLRLTAEAFDIAADIYFAVM